jgi:hypothetical protein
MRLSQEITGPDDAQVVVVPPSQPVYLAYAHHCDEYHLSWHGHKLTAERWLERKLGGLYRQNFEDHDCYGKIWKMNYDKKHNFHLSMLENVMPTVYIFRNGRLGPLMS